MHLSPDQLVYWHHGIFKINGTMVVTWVLMLVLVIGSKLVTRRITADMERSRSQNFLEIIVTAIENQIHEVGLKHPRTYLSFLGTLFLFIAGSCLCTLVPGIEPPTGSLSTTIALALCVFFAVPIFGIKEQGIIGYLKTYAEPTAIMIPFHLISELSRTVALSVRLFGNMMSGSMIVAVLIMIAPLIFPLFMIALGLLTGMVQAYIFTTLAAVYIAAATQAHSPQTKHDAA